MKQPHEAVLAKARKLAALADPRNGGTFGEISAARAALARHMEQHGLTPQDIDPAERTEHYLDCWPVGRPRPKACKDLLKLAVQCLAFVTGTQQKIWPHDRIITPGKRPVKIYVAKAKCTPREAAEWQACFAHYAPALLDSLDDARAKVAQARRILQHTLSGFIHRHDIFPAPTGESGPSQLTEAEIAAICAAMHAARGHKWERPAGALTDVPLIA